MWPRVFGVMKPEEVVISVSAVPEGLRFSSHTFFCRWRGVTFGICGSFRPYHCWPCGILLGKPYRAPQSGPPFPAVFSELTRCFSPWEYHFRGSLPFLVSSSASPDLSSIPCQGRFGNSGPAAISGMLLRNWRKGPIQRLSCVRGDSQKWTWTRCMRASGRCVLWAAFTAAGLGKQLGIASMGNY